MELFGALVLCVCEHHISCNDTHCYKISVKFLSKKYLGIKFDKNMFGFYVNNLVKRQPT